MVHCVKMCTFVSCRKMLTPDTSLSHCTEECPVYVYVMTLNCAIIALVFRI